MKPPLHLRAIGFAVAGFTLWVFGDTLMKLASKADLPPYEIIAFVCLFSAVLMMIKGAAQGHIMALWPRQPGRQLGRVVLALGCGMANAVALKHLPLTLFYAVVFTAPIVISLLAALLLTQSETVDSIAFFSGLTGAFACGGLMAWHAVPVSPSTLLLLLGMAVFTLTGQLCNFTALRLTTAATVSQFHYTQIVAGALLGFLIWQEIPAMHTVLGTAIIIGSGLYIAARGHKRA